MKKLYILLITILITTVSFGQTLITENFDYGSSAGDLTTVSGGKWANHSGSTKVLYATTSLSMTNYPSSGVGGSATIVGTKSEDVNRSFSVTSTGTVYASTLINISAVGTGNYFFHLKDATFGFRARVGAKDNGSGSILFGIGASSSTLTYGTTAFNLNTTYLLVASYEISSGTSNLYILTAPVSTEPGAPEATSTGTLGTAISGVAFRQSSNIPTATLDGVRVATTWNDIMNDPTGPTLSASGAITGLNYAAGSGPSAEKTFTIEGVNLTADITVTAPTNFEVSTTSGSGFGASLTLTQSGGTVASTTLYTRLKTGLSENSYSGDVTVSSTGATSKTITLSGNVVAALTNAMVITGLFDVQMNSKPRGVELFVIKNIPDLSIFGVGSATNGGGTDGQEFIFPAVAATAGQYIYLIATGQEADFTAFFGTGFTADYTSDAMFINGDDAIELFENTLVIDLFGDINVDGTGQPWEYLDGWAYRNSDTGPSSTFTIGNWQFSGTIELDGATNADSSTPFTPKTYTNTLAVSQQQLLDGFAMYPNPVRDGLLNVQSASKAEMNISIFDVIGKQVYQRNTSKTQINISNLKAGMYFVKVLQDGKMATRKLVVE